MSDDAPLASRPLSAALPWILAGLAIVVTARAEALAAGAGFGSPFAALLLRTGAGVVAWLAAALGMHRLLCLTLWDRFMAPRLGGHVPRLLKDLTGSLVFFLAFIGIFGQVFGQSVTGLWAASSAVGLVLGFALQRVILDVFIGLATNIDQPYKIGDWIQLHLANPDPTRDTYGQVLEINWRTTRIRTRYGRVVMIPNSLIGSSTITNYMAPDSLNRRMVSFHIDPQVDPERAARILLAGAAAAVGPEGILAEPAPVVRAAEVTPHGVCYNLKYWWDVAKVSPGLSRDRVVRACITGLHAAGLSVSASRATYYDHANPIPNLAPDRLEDRADLLARIELLAPLDDAEREQLGRRIEVRHLEPEQVLLRRGEAGASMFVLVEGLLGVHIDIGDGTEKRVGAISPGRALGELSLLTGATRSATLIAEVSCVLFEIRKEDLEPILKARPSILERLAAEVASVQLRDEKARADHDEQRAYSNACEGSSRSW